MKVLRGLGLRQFVTMYMYVHVHVHVHVTQSHVLVGLGHPKTVYGSTGHGVELYVYVHCFVYCALYTVHVHVHKCLC